jgi:hypothetical protein
MVEPALPRLQEGDAPATSIELEVATPLYRVLTTEATKVAGVGLPQSVLLKLQLNEVPGASLASVIL